MSPISPLATRLLPRAPRAHLFTASLRTLTTSPHHSTSLIHSPKPAPRHLASPKKNKSSSKPSSANPPAPSPHPANHRKSISHPTPALQRPCPRTPRSRGAQRLSLRAAQANRALPPRPLPYSPPSSSSSEKAKLQDLYDKAIEARGKGEELHPNVRRGARPEFDGDVNPKTGEVGGPKNEPLRWGAAGEWSYNGRTTDF